MNGKRLVARAGRPDHGLAIMAIRVTRPHNEYRGTYGHKF